jgi:hypothetical protein
MPRLSICRAPHARSAVEGTWTSHKNHSTQMFGGKKWNQRLPSHGLRICSIERFANIRYAHDLVLFSMLWKELAGWSRCNTDNIFVFLVANTTAKKTITNVKI